MKQYVIDELRLDDYGKIKAHLDKTYTASGVDGLYWIPMPDDFLSDIQHEHSDCAPFYFAIELEEDHLSCELLIRSQNKIRCNCIAYADEPQRNWMIRAVDAMFEKLQITT
jgi:hypothetical protein